MALRWCIVAVLMSVAKADYDCLCNYNVELEVHTGMSESSSTSGSLYEFDCKASVKSQTVNTGWAAIAFQHQIGYVKTGENTETQMCPGTEPEGDKLAATPGGTTTTDSPTTATEAATTQPAAFTQTTPTTPTPTKPPTTPAPTTVTTTPVPTTVTTAPPTTATTTIPTTATTQVPTTVTTARPTTVTTTSATTVTTPVPTTQTTTTPPTTVPIVVNTTGLISGQTSLCPLAVRSFTKEDRGLLAQYDKSCYELVGHRTTWRNAEQDCHSKGAHLVQINTQGEQDFIYNLVKKHVDLNTWIGLHDQNKEAYYEWSSGESVVYTNWHGTAPHHSSQDCVYLNPHNQGYWDDTECAGGGFITFTAPAAHPYICQYEIDTRLQGNGTHNPHGDGNTHSCPSNIIQHASSYHGILGQYGQSCYELLPRYDVTWVHGERLCVQHGGHLAHISSADEQEFLQDFMTNHMPTHGAWIGLNDRSNEGNFTWTSGSPVSYTNWAKGHSSSWGDRPSSEDCALFLPYANGHWDDIPCGSTFIFGGDTGSTHPILCQYGLADSTHNVIQDAI